MPRVAPPAILLPLILAVALSASGASERNAEIATAWEFVARHLPGDAVARLRQAGGDATREGAFLHAVVMLDVQPITDERMQECATRLGELARGDDDLADASAYLVGRIYQVHFFKADGTKAAAAFTALAERHPDSYWAQLGLVKLALLDLYVVPTPSEPAARVAAAEALLPRVKIPELRRDLHLVLGRGRLFHGLPGVLPHLLAAAEVGGLRGIPRADLQVQIGELSRRAGDLVTARKFFDEYLAENEVDGRVYTVRAKLKEMAASGAAPSP